MVETSRASKVFLAVLVISACADHSTTGLRVVPTEVALAKGGANASASLADGIATSSFPVKKTEGLPQISATGDVNADVSFDGTVAATTSQCWPGTNGATPTEMAELISKLDEPVSRLLVDFGAGISTSNAGLYVRWYEGGYEYFLRLGVSGRAPNSTDPTLTQSGNVYTYTGGTVYLNRSTGSGKNTINAAMVCPNLDQVVLSWPL